MGKSSTINSLLGERVCNVTVFQADRDIPVMVSRKIGDFVLNFIDTPGLVDSGSVNEVNLDRIARFCLGKTINAVLYVDRLDAYRIDCLDRQIIKAITSTFGSKIWDITSVVLTHANIPSPSNGKTYDEFVEARSEKVRDLIRREGRGPWWKFWEGSPEVAVLLVENSSRVTLNVIGEKVLPNEEVFLVRLVEGIVDDIIRGGSGLQINQEFLDGPRRNNRGKLLIPIVILAQYFFVVKKFQRNIKADGYKTQRYKEPWEATAEHEIKSGLQRESLRRIELCRAFAEKQK